MNALPPQRLNVNYLMIHVNRTLTNLHNYCEVHSSTMFVIPNIRLSNLQNILSVNIKVILKI